ncbi:DUF1534 domain-containing protein [Pseudomonas sp. ST1]|nr:DUF1534 domain-containing protein [Pseudomonas savastanoi]TSC38813.1 DUF1534 domain-containing protein [Pseudomonas sp. ST1]
MRLSFLTLQRGNAVLDALRPILWVPSDQPRLPASVGTIRIPARRPFLTFGLGKMILAPSSSTTQREPPASSAST